MLIEEYVLNYKDELDNYIQLYDFGFYKINSSSIKKIDF